MHGVIERAWPAAHARMMVVTRRAHRMLPNIGTAGFSRCVTNYAQLMLRMPPMRLRPAKCMPCAVSQCPPCPEPWCAALPQWRKCLRPDAVRAHTRATRITLAVAKRAFLAFYAHRSCHTLLGQSTRAVPPGRISWLCTPSAPAMPR